MWYPRRDVSPKIAAGAPTTLPGVRVDQSKVIRDARVQTQVVGIVRCHRNDLDGAPRRIEIHLDVRRVGVRGPLQVVARASRDGCVCGVAAGFDEWDDGAVVHDEVAPYLLERVDEIRGRGRRVDGEIGGQIGAVIRRGDGILVLPALFAEARERFCEPVSGTGVCGLVVEVVGALFLTCCEFGLV